MCRISRHFLLQMLTENMADDARDFNNMETRAVIKFSLQGKASKEIHAIPIEILSERAPSYSTVKTGWPSLNVVIFPPVLRLVLEDKNSDHS